MRKCRGIFVTGTDTGVGKTYVSCFLLTQMREQGNSVGAYKPVCSGAERSATGDYFWEDVEQLSLALQGRFEKSSIAPQTFMAPLAPPRAAQLQGTKVDERLLEEGLRWWQTQVDWLLIEGAGGLLAPLSESLLLADWAASVGYPLLIVARAGLGTINHTLLTIEAAQARGLRPVGIVLNETQAATGDQAVRYNWDDLQNRTDVPVLGRLQFQSQALEDRNGNKIAVSWADLFDFSSQDE